MALGCSCENVLGLQVHTLLGYKIPPILCLDRAGLNGRLRLWHAPNGAPLPQGLNNSPNLLKSDVCSTLSSQCTVVCISDPLRYCYRKFAAASWSWLLADSEEPTSRIEPTSVHLTPTQQGAEIQFYPGTELA